MASAIKGNVTNSNPTPGASSYTFNHNQNTGSDGVLIVAITMASTVNYSSVTYGGQAMTLVYNQNRTGLSQRMAFYSLDTPPTGNNNVVINFSGSQWNPISIHARSFTGCGGIGNITNTGGVATPNIKSLTISQDSLVMVTACSINAITSIEIPQGTVRTFVTHNTNRQVGTGAISVDGGHNAGSISLETNSTFGNITLDAVEILASGGSGGGSRRRILIV